MNRSPALTWSWSLPWSLDPTGQIERHVERPFEETVRLILEVIPGERPLLPDFGWRAHFLFPLEGLDRRAIAGILAEEALTRWAPSLDIESVDVVSVVDAITAKEGRLSEDADSGDVAGPAVRKAVLELRRGGHTYRLGVRLRRSDPQSVGGR